MICLLLAFLMWIPTAEAGELDFSEFKAGDPYICSDGTKGYVIGVSKDKKEITIQPYPDKDKFEGLRELIKEVVKEVLQDLERIEELQKKGR